MPGARRELSAEQRAERRAAGKAKAAAAVERLDAGVRRVMEDDDAFAEYLRLSGRMHSYSWGNRLLILLQRPDAGLVAGFHAWKDLGRPVVKGSKGIQILAPMVAKVKDDSVADGEERKIIGFRVAYVFSVHDTDGPAVGKPVPVPLTDDSEQARDTFELLKRRTEQLGCKLEVREGDDLGDGLDGPAGWYTPADKLIVVNGGLPAAARAATLAHELAHHVAGKLGRRDGETVAEGAAFVVAGYFGLDTAAFTLPYVAGWAQDMGRVRQLLESIAKVADEILAHLDFCSECGTDPSSGKGGCAYCMA